MGLIKGEDARAAALTLSYTAKERFNNTFSRDSRLCATAFYTTHSLPLLGDWAGSPFRWVETMP